VADSVSFGIARFARLSWGFLGVPRLAVPAQLRTLGQLHGLKNNQPFGEGTVDDALCRQFFLQPQETFHRRYEALRAYFLDGLPLAEVADRFGYRLSALKSMVCRFRASCVHGGPPPFPSGRTRTPRRSAPV
jgi:hypothetical protein